MLLSLITFLPAIGAIALMFLPNDRLKKLVALGVTLLTFVISLVLWFGWENGQAAAQFVEKADWLPQAGIYYHMGVDGISVLLVLLTTFIMPIAVFFSNEYVHDRVGPYLSLMLLLETAMLGVFCALDLLLFFVFFEFSLIPMYFLIGKWGGENRTYAATKFFLYTFAGSALMLVAILTVYMATGTLNLAVTCSARH